MRRILITWFSKALGGAENSVIDLCNFLSKYKDLKIVLLFVSQDKAFFANGDKINEKVKVYDFCLSLPCYNVLAFFIVFWISVKEKIDIVNVNYRAVFPESLAAKILGKKVVSTIRAVLIDKKNANSFYFTEQVIAISKAVAEKIKSLGYEKSVTVIYNGIDLNKFEIWTPRKKIAKQGFYFLARMVRWKRPDWFVKAAIEVHKEYPKSRFVLFGRGLEEDKLRKIIRENKAGNYVKMGGFISRNDIRLKDYGICVLPSFIEPFGKTILEGILRNNVIVATNSGGVPEILKDYDLLFERDSFDDLVRKMKSAYESFDFYYSEISKIKKKSSEKFNMTRVANDYHNLFINFKLSN